MAAAGRLWAAAWRHRWWWALALYVPLVAFPQIDITVSSWFYDPGYGGFPARIAAFPEWVRRGMPAWLFAVPALITAAWAVGEVLRRPVLGVTRRVVLYVLLSLAVGPGLVVNVGLKDNWGRPRPSTIQEFGGPNTYVRPLVPSRQCDENCSFPSGHGALGFWTVTLALLAPPRWRRPALSVAFGFGAMVGLVRIAQGGHFLSDVVASALITIGISVLFYRKLIWPIKSRSSKNNPSISGESA
ncbi:MAG TPA: phosphatase PAP2 family protein [Magnetospirillum sp.]|nr:phosphatase PAP2 family protein [Magnetospirillum sp.]